MTMHAPLDLTVHRREGMYDPVAEHDACGVGMVATMNRRPERRVIDKAVEVLRNLDHRGAVGAEDFDSAQALLTRIRMTCQEFKNVYSVRIGNII